MTKRRGRIASEPVYEGERSSRTNTQQMHYCERCDRLATHRCQKWEVNQAIELYLCEWHAQEAVKANEIRRLKALPAYAKYLRQHSQWKAQTESGEQEAML